MLQVASRGRLFFCIPHGQTLSHQRKIQRVSCSEPMPASWGMPLVPMQKLIPAELGKAHIRAELSETRTNPCGIILYS